MDASPPDRWRRIQTIFEHAIALEVDARASFVDSTCSTDPALQREVELLLAAHDAAADFLGAIDPVKSAALLSAPAADTAMPEAVGRYRIVRRLGSGAMGVVYLAHDPQLDRPVALKLLRARHAGQRRLLDEARAASALDHPNVAAIHEIGETADGWPFIAMTYCEGESLADRIARGPLPVRDAVHITQQIADALAAAHALGIVHRDVKPANIVVSADGRARLMDFGVASVVGRHGHGDRAVAGTPAYMSPEQIRREVVAPAADVWAVGVVLYEMLTGVRPFRSESRDALEDAVLEAAPVGVSRLRPEVSPALARIAERCLARDPAERSDAALLATELQSLLGTSSSSKMRRRAQVLAGAFVMTLVLAGLLVRDAGDVGVPAGAALVVLPFVPVVPDSLLERIGHELVVTLSTNLDGVAGLYVVAPIAVLGQQGAGVDAALETRADFARRLGAGSMLDGRASRTGTGVRVDATVYDVNDLTVIARASAEASPHDISALTDSLTLALMRTAWRGRPGPAPNLAAITTNSLPALRAYLEGELAIAGGRFRSAPGAFERAIQADSTFWFAYWRYLYAQSYHNNPVDSAIVAKVIEHRSDFPEPDRLLVESGMQPGQRAQLALRRSISVRHPTYWPAFFELGDQLTHHGPFIGEPAEEARIALRRTIELNPNFVPALNHLLWLDILAQDTLESARVLAQLTTLRLDSLLRDEWSHQPLDYYQYLHDLSRSGGEPRPEMTELGARLLANFKGPFDPERNATTLTNYGFHRAQLELSKAIGLRRPRARIAAAHVWGIALAWAARGAWDSAFVSARQYARSTTHRNGSLWAYGLVSAGAWLGGLQPDSAAVLRAGALRSEQGRMADGAAEIAWLDGLLACTRGDRDELRRQHGLLRASSATGAPTLARSLSAFDHALAGRVAEAGHIFAALERENADVAWQFRHGPRHPFVIGVNRLAAGRLLLSAGDTADAVSLLLLHEVDLPQTLHPMPTVSFMLGTYALAGLARFEQARGNHERARYYRSLFGQRVDLAPTTDVLANATVCASRRKSPS